MGVSCHDCEHLETASVDLSAFTEDYKDGHYQTCYCNKLMCAFGEMFIEVVAKSELECKYFDRKVIPNP